MCFSTVVTVRPCKEKDWVAQAQTKIGQQRSDSCLNTQTEAQRTAYLTPNSRPKVGEFQRSYDCVAFKKDWIGAGTQTELGLPRLVYQASDSCVDKQTEQKGAPSKLGCFSRVVTMWPWRKVGSRRQGRPNQNWNSKGVTVPKQTN